MGLQHQVPIPTGNGSYSDLSYLDRTFYELGWIDLCTLVGYTCFLLFVSTLLEDLVLTNIVFHGLGDATKRSRLVIQMTFYAVTFVHAMLSFIYGHFGRWHLWNGYADSVMPMVSKQFLLTQIGFYTAVLMYQFFLKADDDTPLIPYKMEVTFNLVLNLLALNGRCSILPLVVIFAVPHAAFQLAGLLARYSDDEDDGFTRSMGTICKIGTVVENVYMPLMTLLMCFFGGSMHVMYRVCLFVLSGIWSAINFLIFYYQWLDEQAAAQPAGRRRAAAVPAGPVRRSPRAH